MADLEKTVSIIFSGDDRISKTATSIAGSFDKIDAAVMTVAQPLADAADMILKVDAALAAMAIGGLAYAYAKSVEFESATIELKKVIGEEVDQLDVAKQTAMELSGVYGESASAVLQSTANFKQAGWDVRDSMQLAKDAMDLVIAGDLEASEASEILISTLKGFRAPAEDAARLIDILNEVSNKYATDVRQLGAGMAGLSPIARTMGFSMEETAGILTPVIEIFRSGDEAAIALKTGLLKLVDDAKPVRTALASIGVSQTDANGALRSGKDILADVSEKFLTLDENQKLFVTQQLVGIEQSARMVEVFNNLGKATEITATAMKAAGSASEEVKTRLAGAEATINRFQQGFVNLAIVVGDQFRIAATEAIAGGTEIELALQHIVSDGTLEPIFAALRGFAGDIGDLLRTIAKNLPDAFKEVDFSQLLGALGDIRENIESVFDGIDLTTPEGLAKAIQFVIDTVESLVRVTDGMVEAFKPFIEGIVGSIDGFNQLDDAAKENAGNILGTAKALVDFGIVIAGVLTTIGQHADTMKVIFDIIINTIGMAWNSFAAGLDTIKLAFAGLVFDLLEIADTINFGVMQEEIDGAKAKMASWGESIQKSLVTNAFEAAENSKKVAQAIGLVGDEAEGSEAKVTNLGKAAASIPSREVEVTLAYDEFLSDVDGTAAALRVIPDLKTTLLTAEVDAASIKESEDVFDSWMPDGKGVMVWTGPDQLSLDKTKQTIDQKLPKKTVDVETKLDMERIEANAKIVQTSLEWKAKVDIAEIEASAEIIKANFVSIDNVISTTAEQIGGLYRLWGESDVFEKGQIERWIKEQQEKETQALELQTKLTEAQIEYMNARTNSLNRGDPVITISADGLEPELEAFMWRILERVQIRATEENAEFLLGIT